MDSHFPSEVLGCNDHGSPYPQISFVGHYPRPPTPRMSSSPPVRSLKHPCPLPMLKLRNITPPEDKPTQDMEPADTPKAAQPQYEQALAAVKQLNKECPERPVSLTLSGRDFHRLMEDLGYDKSDQKWPKNSYNASTSSLVIQCMPSPVHETIITTFAAGFFAARLSLPNRYQNNIRPVTGEDFNDFKGCYSGSRKIADLAVKFPNNAGDVEFKFVLEVGFSESYDSLVQDAKLWIEGTLTVSIFVLVQLEEAPNYRCPTSDLPDEAFDALQLPLSATSSMFKLPPRQYGPATYRGFCWAGEILRAEVEVWRKDALTGKACTDGQRMDILSSDPLLTFRLSDFTTLFPGQHDSAIEFNWDNCRVALKDEIQGLAKYRYIEMMKARGKRRDSRDPDYQP